MNEQEMKEWIDEASYEDLLSKWRHSPSGDPFFRGLIGSYFAKVMFEKGDKLPHSKRVAISKRVR